MEGAPGKDTHARIRAVLSLSVGEVFGAWQGEVQEPEGRLLYSVLGPQRDHPRHCSGKVAPPGTHTKDTVLWVAMECCIIGQKTTSEVCFSSPVILE